MPVKNPQSNVTVVKCPSVKCHWRSKVPRSNVTCGQVFLILVADQKSRGQMSLRSNVLRSNVPRSNVTGGQVYLILVADQKIPWSNVTVVKCDCGQMSRGQLSLAVNGPAVKCHLRSSFPNLGCRSKIPRSNVTAVKCPTVKRHWWSKVPWSNVTCGQVFLILVAGQKYRGQTSLAVKGPAVK